MQRHNSILKLPAFAKSPRLRAWIKDEQATGHVVRSLWRAASAKERHDPKFVCLLVQCGWTNEQNDGQGRETTRAWRNKLIAKYLRIASSSTEKQLAIALTTKFQRLTYRSALRLVKMHSGIAAYYRPYRTNTCRFVLRHAKEIGNLFVEASSRTPSATEKARHIVSRIKTLPKIRLHDHKISPLNGLTPTLACLDPQYRFPIMNARTRQLLHKLGKRRDADGAEALCHLMINGSIEGVHDAFDLDVYALNTDFSKLPTPRRTRANAVSGRSLGLKSELAVAAYIQKGRTLIRRRHNALTNDLRDALLGRFHIEEADFDALIRDWQPGRLLLIEAKTASSGTGGRTQIRQAIGQLLDYRFSHFRSERVDLAILLRSRPSPDIEELLLTNGIELLWFKHGKLTGTDAVETIWSTDRHR